MLNSFERVATGLAGHVSLSFPCTRERCVSTDKKNIIRCILKDVIRCLPCFIRALTTCVHKYTCAHLMHINMVRCTIKAIMNMTKATSLPYVTLTILTLPISNDTIKLMRAVRALSCGHKCGNRERLASVCQCGACS